MEVVRPGFRCPNDPLHDTFRVLASHTQKIVRFMNGKSQPRLKEETVLESHEEIMAAVCSEFGEGS